MVSLQEDPWRIAGREPRRIVKQPHARYHGTMSTKPIQEKSIFSSNKHERNSQDSCWARNRRPKWWSGNLTVPREVSLMAVPSRSQYDVFLANTSVYKPRVEELA